MKNLIQIYNSETLDTKIVSKFKIYGLLILIVLTFSSFGYFIGSFKNEEKHIKFPSAIFNHNVILSEKYENNFSEEELFSLMKRLKIRHIDIVISQAKIETGNFKSKVFIENNNLFGMRFPGNRVTLAKGENLKHAVYDNWQESVIDYAIYQSTYLRKYSRNEYLKFLELNYAENKDYVSLINKISKQYN